MVKSVLFIKCGSCCICNSEVLFWCVWCATVCLLCYCVSGVLLCVWCATQKFKVVQRHRYM